jgi:AIPR protein
VKSRDIRSNDYAQKKLERELLAKGYYYERKKAQYQDKPRAKRIDAEKAGQVLMAFFNEMPAEAKDNKRLIFAEKYDEVFNDSVSADTILLSLFPFDDLERERKRIWDEMILKLLSKTEALESSAGIDVSTDFEAGSFIMHASYYLLYVLKKLAELNNIQLRLENREAVFGSYSEAKEMLEKTIEMERAYLQKRKESYGHRVFFKGNRPKKHLDSLLTLWPDWRSGPV